MVPLSGSSGPAEGGHEAGEIPPRRRRGEGGGGNRCEGGGSTNHDRTADWSHRFVTSSVPGDENERRHALALDNLKPSRYHTPQFPLPGDQKDFTSLLLLLPNFSILRASFLPGMISVS
jgi:hypothetical protein